MFPNAGKRVGLVDLLYTAHGLEAARQALKPGGILAIWSAWEDEAFAMRLAQAGFLVEEVKVRERAGNRGAHHVLWFARRRPESEF